MYCTQLGLHISFSALGKLGLQQSTEEDGLPLGFRALQQLSARG